MGTPLTDLRIDVLHTLDAGEVDCVSRLLAAAARADDHPPLGEQKRLDLAHGLGTGSVGLLARVPESGVLLGYAQLGQGPVGSGGWNMEVVVDPSARRPGIPLFRRLLAAATEEISTQGGGEVTLWVSKPSTDHDGAAAAMGLTSSRDLLQMRHPLPLPGGAPDIVTRPFVPGQDEAAWLAANNKAFADHPEQGGWESATLVAREREAWFDPSGFLLAELDGRLAGSCWTKVHRDTVPRMGEIYVISVDPDFHGRGLGRALCLAGLHWLATVGGASIGMLYVDADNAPAVSLYRHLGFTEDHVDRAYTGTVAAKE